MGERLTDLSHSFHLLAVDWRKDSEFWFPELHERMGPLNLMAVHYALALGGEVGELQNKVKKAYLYPSDKRKFDRDEMAGEVADSLIYLVDLAHEMKLNPIDCVEAKHAQLVERWGARQSSGTP